MTYDELYNLDAFIFLEMVEGHLLWQEQKDDTLLNWMAWFTANQMVITGNMRKGIDAMDVKRNLYESLEDKQEKSEDTLEKRRADAQAEKARLAKRFGLEN